MSELIHLQNISKTFSNHDKPALSKVNLKINEGEMTAIVGPSGSGKSTLLSIIGLLDSPSNGQYTLKDTNVATLTAHQIRELRNHQIGWIFQNFNLIGSMTCLENVAAPLRYNKRISRSEYKKRALEGLEQMGLADKANQFPYQLSGGQQQRIAIARALINQPALIVADEPTGNLDSETSELIMQRLHTLHQAGTTLLIVTHNPDIASQCNRTVTITDGELRDAG